MKQGTRWKFTVILLISGLISSAAVLQKTDKAKTKEKEAKEAPLTEEKELELGKQLYDAQCKMCHKADGKGSLEEMDLTDGIWKHGNTPEEVEKVIREGVKGTGMRAIMGDHTDQEIKALVKYVLKFSANAAPPAEGAKPAEPTPPPPVPPMEDRR